MVTDWKHQLSNLMLILEERNEGKKNHDLSLAHSNNEDEDRSTPAIAKRFKKYL